MLYVFIYIVIIRSYIDYCTFRHICIILYIIIYSLSFISMGVATVTLTYEQANEILRSAVPLFFLSLNQPIPAPEQSATLFD